MWRPRPNKYTVVEPLRRGASIDDAVKLVEQCCALLDESRAPLHELVPVIRFNKVRGMLCDDDTIVKHVQSITGTMEQMLELFRELQSELQVGIRVGHIAIIELIRATIMNALEDCAMFSIMKWEHTVCVQCHEVEVVQAEMVTSKNLCKN